MFREAASAGGVVRAQLEADAALFDALGATLRALAPRAVVTCARGSSDHAATYAKYLIETRARVLCASAAPSVASVYGIGQDLGGCVLLAISQSGRSPDLIATVERARDCGATVVALCNTPDTPLVAAADHVIPLRAGAERSVAATKSYLATLVALARFVAAWTDDAGLAGDLAVLPAELEQAWQLDWSAALDLLAGVEHLYVVGRGLGLAAAQEVALKFKETCGLHAEAFSGAEVRHGPFALLGPRFPALILAQQDATRDGLAALARDLVRQGVPTMLAGASAAGAIELPTIACRAELEPVLQVAAAYRLLAELAVRRGLDPDQPPHLRKVTETI
jgi:glucosamine--fructose-6-phosphate aminotransferase (isomerizing)